MRLQRLSDCKQSQRSSGPLGFVYRSWVKSDGNRGGLVHAGVVELALDHDHDRGEAGAAVGRQLQQANRAGTFVDLSLGR